MSSEVRFSVDEVAARLRVTPRRIHSLVRSGKLGCIQVTAKVRVFTEQQVEAFEQARTVSPVSVPAPVPKTIDKPASRVSSSRPTPSNKRATREGRANAREAVPGVKLNKGNSSRAQVLKELRSWR